MKQKQRTRARRRALEVLHAADVASGDPLDGFAAGDPAYARALVEGVASHREALDGVIRGAAEHWTMERMPVVDRNLIRIGAFEILHRPDVPVGAAIDDLVGLAKLLSTEGSGRFVNGVLGRIARDHAR